MTFILLAQSQKELDVMKWGVRLSLLHKPEAPDKSIAGNAIHTIIVSGKEKDNRHSFNALAQVLENALSDGELTVIVSHVRPLLLNPLIHRGWESVIAMLILAYPDAQWLFGSILGYTNNEKPKTDKALDAFRAAHGIGNLFKSLPNPLFDPAGLRDWVRKVTTEKFAPTDGGQSPSIADAAYLTRRQSLANSLDEEMAYSYLHAYTAYRFGFRAAAVTSSRVADRILGVAQWLQDPCLVFEDIYVNFADGRPGMSWLDANPNKKEEGRSKVWPRLERAEHRIFVTSGQRVRGDEEKWESNRAYIARQKIVQHITTLYKPYAGIFRIWQDSKLARRLKWTDDKGKTRRGTAVGFVWPPPRESFTDTEHGHSSPGVLLVIAEKLIERAGKLTDSRTITDAIRGAVLATDALEILGCRTPTVAVEALRLKHYFEVLAECQFSGVEHHIHLEDRLKEIQRDVREIGHWFGRKQRTAAALNAEMMILLCLVRLLQAQCQFDEEQYLMHRVRQLHNSLWLRQGLGGLRWRYIFWPFLRYSEFLLKSFSRFAVSIAAWISGLTAAFWYLRVQDHTLQDGKSLSPGWEAVSRAFSAFTGSDPLTVTGFFFPVLTGFAVLAGLAHLGIFVSHLYTLVSRK